MAKDNKDNTAFPGRTNAMGYSTGLTKLEYIATQLFASGRYTADEAVAAAAKLLKSLEAANEK